MSEPPPSDRSDPGAKPSTAGTSPDDRSWTLVAHFGAAIALVLSAGALGWLVPLAVLLIRGNSPVVRYHATEAANFQLTWGCAVIGSVFLGLCASVFCLDVLVFGLAGLAFLFALAMTIFAGLRARENVALRYPFSFRLIR